MNAALESEERQEALRLCKEIQALLAERKESLQRIEACFDRIDAHMALRKS